MTITLDHTIVHSHDKAAAAAFFAAIFELDIEGAGHFAPVRVNDQLTLDFADNADVTGQHYAFLVDEADFDSVFDRIKAMAADWGSGPMSHTDRKINHRRGGRGLYFTDGIDPHLWEIMTTPETVSRNTASDSDHSAVFPGT